MKTMARWREIAFESTLADRLRNGPGAGISLFWLGQAGFVIDADHRRIVIDPYLSDSLATKYRGTPYPHERMAPAPLSPDQLGPVDLVLSTHHHTDHMDGETLARLAARLPALTFVVPAAARALAMTRIGVDADRLVLVDAGETRTIAGLGLHVLRAAHETLERDEAGHHRFLGYGLEVGGSRIFHSGDTIPFDRQEDEVRAFAPDLALLPVNGRSAALRAAGFAGNLTLPEAITLCSRAHVASMIAHHHGMFAFNTLSPEGIEQAMADAPIAVHRARYNTEFRLDGL